MIALLTSSLAVAQETQAGEGVDDRRQARIEQTVERIWWNRADRVATLGLTAETRARMDELLRQHLKETYEMPTRVGPMQAMAELMVAGDWQAAEVKSEEVVEASAAPIRRQMKLMIEVMKLLDEGQRQTLKQELPQLMKRPWVRMARMNASRAAGGPRRQR
ncbi:MAG: hypothetical protein MI919_09305 [Holophagales bacterium]|nr:hypothetical protein [Holophagales bacterium]